MPFDSAGVFSRLHCWEDDRINDIDIVTDHMDEEDDNFADGLSQCFLKNGTSQMEGNLNAGNFKLINVADGALPSDAVNRKQLDTMSQTSKEVMNLLVKIGDIKASVISTNHDNWILCDGQELLRSEYSDLFELIGTGFGQGDGVTTFNVPDYRGKFLRGLGGNSASDIYTPQAESLPDHTHPINVSDYGHPDGGADSSETGYKYWRELSNGSPQHTEKASASNSLYSGLHVTPENYAINWFIKAKKEE